MSFPIEYTPSTITLFIIDSLMGKCHLMLAQCTIEDIKLYNEELERQYEASNPFYLEQNQEEYIRRWTEVDNPLVEEIDRIIEEESRRLPPSGDRALDDEEDWCSDMEDCLLPATEELIPTDVDEENDDEPELSAIDFSEEINLNELYN